MEKKLESKKKLFNPKTMVKYDRVVCNDGRSLWVCKFCLKILLSEASSISHHAICKPAPTKRSSRIEKRRKAETSQAAETIQMTETVQVVKRIRRTKRIRPTKKTQMAKRIRLIKKEPEVQMAMKTPKVENNI